MIKEMRQVRLLFASLHAGAAQIMQRTLLPDALPHVPGIRFSANYLSAGTGAGVRIDGRTSELDWLAELHARSRRGTR
jgi:hypothetical protein